MATRSLGTLTLDLIAKIGGFEAGMDKAARSAKKKSDEISRAISAITKTMVGVGLAATTATAALVKSQIDFADKVSKTSKIVGLSVEDLSALNYQADLSGVSFEELGTGMTRFSRVVDDAFNGVAAGKEAFDRLGIGVANSDGSLKSNMQLLQEVTDVFASMEDGATKTALAQDLFGRSGAKLIPLLNGGRAELEKYREEAEAFGQVLDTKSAQSAEAFNDNLTRLGKVVSGVGNELAAALLPQLVEFTDMVNSPEFRQNLKSIVTLIADMAIGVGNLTGELIALPGQFSLLGQSIIGQAEELDVLNQKIRDVERALKGGLSTPIKFIGTPDEELKKLRESLVRERDLLLAELTGKPVEDLIGLESAIAGVDEQIEQLRGQLENSGGRSKTGIQAQIDDLIERQRRLNAQLALTQELRNSEFDQQVVGDDPFVATALDKYKSPSDSLPESAKKYLEQLERQKALMGENTEVAKLMAEIQLKTYGELTEKQQGLLIEKAKELDILREQAEAEKDLQTVRESAKDYVNSLKEQAALSGVQTEKERALHEVQAGRFAMLDAGTKANILAAAEQLDLVNQQLEAERQLRELEEGLLTDAERINKAWDARIKIIKDAGLEQAKADELIQKSETKRAAELKALSDNAKDSLNEFMLQAQRNIQSQFADSIYDMMSGSFDNILDDWDKMLKKMAAQMLAQQILSSIGNWGKANSGAGGVGGALAGFASMFAGSGGAGAGATAGAAGASAGGGNWLGAAAGMFAGMFDKGGSLRAGQWGIVGERGPELVTGPANVIGRAQTAQLYQGGMGSRTVNQNVNVSISGRPDKRTPEQIARASGREARRAMVRSGA